MTIDEKLQHFMDVTTEKVNAENAKQMQEYEQGHGTDIICNLATSIRTSNICCWITACSTE